MAGASKLIEQRGPRNFKTDFDLAILTAQIGPIVRIHINYLSLYLNGTELNASVLLWLLNKLRSLDYGSNP